MKGYHKRALYINLSTGESKVKPLMDGVLDACLGGKGSTGIRGEAYRRRVTADDPGLLRDKRLELITFLNRI